MITRYTWFLINMLAIGETVVNGFSARPASLQRRQLPPADIAQCHALDTLSTATFLESSTSVTIAEASWRQYVSLVVVAGVVIDIVLGSPLANMVLKPLRDAQQDDEEIINNEAKASNVNRSKERIDSEKFAQDAIDRAQNALELRKFLDERKTDWDRMEEMKRKLDEEMQDLDNDLQMREESLAKRREGTKGD